MVVTLDSTLFYTTASTSGKEASSISRIYLPISDITYSKRNSQIVVIKADDSKNKFGYSFLAFCDNNELSMKKAKPVVEYESDGVYSWYGLKHDKTTQRPYLGKRLPEVDEFDDDA